MPSYDLPAVAAGLTTPSGHFFPFRIPARSPEMKSMPPLRRGIARYRLLEGVPPRMACRVVRQLVLEIVVLAAERPLRRRDTRRAGCHVRQIAMYVCHVVLQIPMSDIGPAFGRDRTTVGHACNVVEDRRDDPAFDEFVCAIERIVLSVFGPAGLGGHE
ncbi:MAG: helix-turn-helix domain-containing protein [Shinella sp.]|nr:helix-turn-helix domain-containing protein [Shinella sp.]